MLRKYLCAIVLMAVSASLYAEAGGLGGFTIGAGFPGIQSLNERLKPYGLDLRSPMVLTGGAGYAFGRHVILGGFGYGGAVQAENNDEIVKFSGGGGGFEIGKIWKAGPAWFAAMATLGGFGYEMRFRPKLQDVDFDSLVVYPRRVAILTAGGVLIGASGMLIFPVSGPFSLGLKAGVYYTPTAKKWSLDDGGKVFNAPEVSPLHYSAQVMLLFGKVVQTPAKEQ